MYPFFRLMKEMFIHRKAERLPATGTHVSHHICWPWDLDPWIELNNGRTLTLYDLGRIPLANRAGLIGALKENGWGLTMAGASVRYRRRVRAFDRIEMHSRLVGTDDRFLYLEQSMWVKGQAASHILYRSAVTDKNGIVPTSKVRMSLGLSDPLTNLPDWINAWIEAENLRPWPPETNS
jgi:acyl-CoA thioesterase FadM